MHHFASKKVREWVSHMLTLLTSHYHSLNQPLLPLYMVCLVNGPICLVLVPTLTTCFNHWKMLSEKSLFLHLQKETLPMTRFTTYCPYLHIHIISGLGLSNPCSPSESRYKASTAITLPLVNAILGESNQSAYEVHCAQLNLISK